MTSPGCNTFPGRPLRCRYGVIMLTTAMGLVANMSLMTALTEKVPSSTCGFLAFLFIITPLTMWLVTLLIGALMAAIEGWDFHDGYFFMAASMASLANPVSDAMPETALGAFFECMCLAIELCIGGCILGLVAAHPATLKLCNFLEGGERLQAAGSSRGGPGDMAPTNRGYQAIGISLQGSNIILLMKLAKGPVGARSAA
eukprot:Skav205171  [mRNA]  locus=scaffold2773:197205:202686:- [translate_table: standard]